MGCDRLVTGPSRQQHTIHIIIQLKSKLKNILQNSRCCKGWGGGWEGLCRMRWHVDSVYYIGLGRYCIDLTVYSTDMWVTSNSTGILTHISTLHMQEMVAKVFANYKTLLIKRAISCCDTRQLATTPGDV